MELLLQSIIVYGFIIFVMTNAGLYTYRHQYPNGFLNDDSRYNHKSSFIDLFTKSHFLIPLLVYCFFVTVRYKVGEDCESYKQDFYNILQGKENRETLEEGFTLLLHFCTIFTNKHYLYFFLMGFLQIGALYYSLRKEGYLLIFFGITLFFGGTFFSLMNGMRQNITACIFVAMTPLILNKKYWIWVIPATLLAMTMHRTAIIIVPMAIIGYILKNRLPNTYIQLAIITLCYIFMDKAENLLTADFFNFASISGYSEEAIEHYSEYSIEEKAFGLRSYLLLLANILVVLHYKKLKRFYNSTKFNYAYTLFFIGVCITLLFYNNYVMNRLMFFSSIFSAIIQSYLLFYLWYNKTKSNNLIFHLLIIILMTHIIYYFYSAMNMPGEKLLYKFDL